MKITELFKKVLTGNKSTCGNYVSELELEHITNISSYRGSRWHDYEYNDK